MCTTSKVISDENWWKKNVIYQVYPRSFFDSNGDGIGDLRGILEKLDYFDFLGINVLWLSPIYKSPMADFGYDISDYKDIDKMFGTMEDFKELLSEMHIRNMYLIMDLVPNHTSDQHPWFVESVKRNDPFSDFYVWKEPKVHSVTGERCPPNNWQSCFGGPSWTYCEERGQYYLHQFLKEQPDLNYRCPEVRKQMENVIKFWLNLGVDGFRIDAINHLIEHKRFLDNVGNKKYNVDMDETFEVVKEWIKLCRTFGKANGKYVCVLTEAYTGHKNLLKFYKAGVDIPFNFSLINWNKYVDCQHLKKLICDYMKISAHNRWPNWVIDNHDQHRVAKRLGGREYVDVANILLLLLPGTPTCYYGDELAMEDVDVTFEQCQDPFGKKLGADMYYLKSRDPCRSPMLWSVDGNAGFTQSEPWLPIDQDFRDRCVDAQKSATFSSHLNLFKRLLLLRQEPTFSGSGTNLKFLSTEKTSPILAFLRSLDNCPSYLVVLNVGQEDAYSVFQAPSGLFRQKGRIVVRTINFDEGEYELDSIVELNEIKLKKAQGLVLHVQETVMKGGFLNWLRRVL